MPHDTKPYIVDEYRAHDEALVFDSWLRGYRSSPRARKLSDADYEANQRQTIKRLLKRSRVLVARPVEWPEGIMAWLAAEQTPDAFVIHWYHVKPPYRSLNLAEALLEAFEPRGARVFSHLRPPATNRWTDAGFTFAPNRAL